ncbi:AbrB/MazE/SpoVT family DNA-binding domain-containing protein [Chloroflexota bacterium]
MTTAYIKKVIKIGGSLAIILPTEWARGNVKAGEEMVLVGNGELHIFPVRSKFSHQNRKDESERAENT